MRIPYDGIQANKHISRLKCDLKTALSEPKISGVKEKFIPTDKGVVDETLKMAGSLQKQNTDLTGKITELVNRLKELEDIFNGGDYEKAKFLEGAVWMANKISKEIGMYSRQIDELISEFNKRTQEKDIKEEIDVLFISSTQAWLLESIDCACGYLRQKMVTLLDTAKVQLEKSEKKIISIPEKTEKEHCNFLGYVEEIEKMIREKEARAFGI